MLSLAVDMSRFLGIILFIVVACGATNNKNSSDNECFIKSENESFYEIVLQADTSSHFILMDSSIYKEGWHLLAQPIFWKKIMQMDKDSGLLNIASNRKVISEYLIKEWDKKSDVEKDLYRDSIKMAHGLEESDRVYITSGKNHFYAFDKVLPFISRGIEAFMKEGVDPFYAQSILLIESPNKLQYSSTRAYGSFQLMKEVAREMGLTVNRYIDEREDFDKSAMAAARLIKRICIPEAERILNKYSITYNQKDLWFRLFVMHIYHAGAGNVEGVLGEFCPEAGNGDMGIIINMWLHQWGGFKNASQNYSQVALASLLTLYEIAAEANYRYDCTDYCGQLYLSNN